MKKMIMFLLVLLLAIPAYAKNVRVIYRPDGGVSVVRSVGGASLNEAMPSELIGMPYDDMDESELPVRDEYRNAWEPKPGGKGVRLNESKKNALKVAKEKKVNDKKNAIDKLKALGLTEDELGTLLK